MECKRKFKVGNSLGLHARAAAKIVELAKQYDAKLYLRRGSQEVDGSSILSILTLACPVGTEIEVRTVGKDSEALLHELTKLFEQRFGERQ